VTHPDEILKHKDGSVGFCIHSRTSKGFNEQRLFSNVVGWENNKKGDFKVINIVNFASMK